MHEFCVHPHGSGHLDMAFCIHLMFQVDEITHKQMWNCVMLKEFPNISVLLEQIYIFKARIAELAVVTLLYFKISPVEKINNKLMATMNSLVTQTVKKIFLQFRRPGFDPWGGKIPWKRKWQPTPVFLPGGFNGERSLAGYSPWSQKELDTAEWLTHTPWIH